MIRSASAGPRDSAVSRPRGRASRGDEADTSLTIATVSRQQQQQQQQQQQDGGGQQEEEDLLRGIQPLPRYTRGCGDRACGGYEIRCMHTWNPDILLMDNDIMIIIMDGMILN